MTGNVGCLSAFLAVIVIMFLVGVFAGEYDNKPSTIKGNYDDSYKDIVVSERHKIKKEKSTSEPALSQEDKDKLEKFVDSMIEDGTIQKLDAQHHKVYLNPYTWSQIDVEIKEIITINMASYCKLKSTHDNMWVEIYDFQSGKILAKYGALGFKVY